MAQPLAPLPKAIGVNPSFVAKAPVVLQVKESVSWSGGDFTISDQNGQPVLRCGGKTFSMSGRIEFFMPNAPPNSTPLFTLKERHFSIRDKRYLVDSHGSEFVNLIREFSFIHDKITVTFQNTAGGGGDIILNLKGDYLERKAEITWNGTPVARIRRKTNFGHIFFDKNTYALELAPGCDVVLFSAITVALDAILSDNSGS